MPGGGNSLLAKIIERIGRNYENIFEQFPPDGEEGDFLNYPFLDRARAFKKAADLVSSSIIENSNLSYSEMVPSALFLYRHAIELDLKHMRTLLVEHVSPKYHFRRIHKLLDLWTPIEEYLKNAHIKFVDGTLHYRVARAIDEFSRLDVDGQLFRYPDPSTPAAGNWIKVDFPNLRLSVTEIDLFAFGFHELISVFENDRSK